MAQVLVRDLPEDVVERLKARARSHGRSLEGELRTVLEEAARPDRAEFRQLVDEFRADTVGRQATDSVTLLREDRDR